MTYYKMDFECGYDGYYKCNERDTYYCQDRFECPLCIHEKHSSEIKQMWRDLLAERSPDRSFAQLVDSMSDDQFTAILDMEYSRQSNPHYTFYFDEEYEKIAQYLAQYDTVIDLGCGIAMQGMLFPGVRYIGVDDFYPENMIAPTLPAGCEYHQCKAQDFVELYSGEFNKETTLAICLNVPDEAAREAVCKGFENNIVIYSGERLSANDFPV